MTVYLLHQSGPLKPWVHWLLGKMYEFSLLLNGMCDILFYKTLCVQRPHMLYFLLSSSHSQMRTVSFLNSHVSVNCSSSCHSNINNQGRDFVLDLLHLGDMHSMASICFLNISRAINIFFLKKRCPNAKKIPQSWQK